MVVTDVVAARSASVKESGVVSADTWIAPSDPAASASAYVPKHPISTGSARTRSPSREIGCSS